MPVYEYVCDACGYHFERIQSFKDEPLTECPDCGGAVRRVISPVGIIFKGSGWYVTDSKRQLGNGKSKSAPRRSKSHGDEAKTSSEGDRGRSDGSESKSSSQEKPSPKESSKAAAS
jgi:putative FmdB family regulatory protein